MNLRQVVDEDDYGNQIYEVQGTRRDLEILKNKVTEMNALEPDKFILIIENIYK